MLTNIVLVYFIISCFLSFCASVRSVTSGNGIALTELIVWILVSPLILIGWSMEGGKDGN